MAVGYITEARTGRLRPRAGVGASASRRLRGRSLRGEGARAAAGPAFQGGPRRLTFVAHSSKSGVTQYWQGVPGAVRARIRPGSVRIALLFINTMFWSGTCFVSVSAARLAGRRLYIKESMKSHFCKKIKVHILMRICTIELRIGAPVVGILRIPFFRRQIRHRERSDL